MSDELKTEPNDDRYVAICSHIKTVGNELREEIFAHVEEGEIDEASDKLDQLVKLDRIYMLSLKTGMEIVENNRKAQQVAEAKTKTPAPAPAN